MRRIQGLIAAAGAGTRARLPYPKTLFEVRGKPILVRALELLGPVDPAPTLIVSPLGLAPITACVEEHGLDAFYVVQDAPRGMGDAVLRLADSAAEPAEHVVLMWGDVPFIRPETLAAMLERHFAADADFTLATGMAQSAYTVVRRDAADRVVSVSETREAGQTEPGPGERDIGLFVFRREPVMRLLAQDLPGRTGARTGEHGFLYLIGHLAAQGFRVEAAPVATALEMVSLNALDDVRDYL